MKKNFSYLMWTTACAVSGIGICMAVWLWSSYINKQQVLADTATQLLFEAVHIYSEPALSDTSHFHNDTTPFPGQAGIDTPSGNQRGFKKKPFRPRFFLPPYAAMQQMDSLLFIDTLRGIITDVLRKAEIPLTFRVGILHLSEIVGPEPTIHFDFRRDQKTTSDNLLRHRNMTVSFHQISSRPLPLSPDKQLFLQLSLNDPFVYIMHTLKWQIIAAILLTSLTLGCFVYMLYLLRRQKKLAEMKADFVNNMTHELKTPVATVSAAVEALDRFGAIHDQGKAKHYLGISKRELRYLSALIEKVMDMAAHDTHKITLRLESIDAGDLLRQVADRYRNVPGKAAYIVVQCAMDSHSIYADRLHLGNALGNLIDNSIKYGGEHVQVILSCISRGNELVIQVQDNGPGINSKYQPHVFERFFRVPSGDIHRVKGHGLGLAYVKQVIELHKGTVYLESSSANGTTFKIIIPVR